MDTTKFGAIWKLITTRNSLKSKITLMLYLQRYNWWLYEEIHNQAIDTGEAETLSALIAVIDEQLDGRK